jgi:CheY-like chemotaxis protein
MGNAVKFLLVDDEALVRRSLGRVLRGRGHEVVEAVDGTEGLAKWKSEDPDAVFLDVLMPGLTGPQVLDALGIPRRAKVVLMSAFSGEQGLQQTAQQAVDLFLPKPFEDIFEVVRQAEELLK